jgi:tetratricopeptide (TPR) repeat protein
MEESHHKDRESRLEQGIALFRQRHQTEAIAYFESHLERSRDVIEQGKAHYWLAECYFHLKDYDMAMCEYNASIECNPNNFQVYFDRGYLYQKRKVVKKAIDDFTQAIKLNKEHASSYHNRGIAYKQQGDLQSAIDDLRKAVALRPNTTETSTKSEEALINILLPRARRRVMSQTWTEALELMHECIAIQPWNFDLLLERAEWFEECGRLKDAFDDYSLALERRPHSSVARKARAKIAQRIARWESAADDYQQLMGTASPSSCSILQQKLTKCEQMISTDKLYRDEDYRSI